MESPCECGIESPGSISHGVSYIYQLRHEIMNRERTQKAIIILSCTFTDSTRSIVNNRPIDELEICICFRGRELLEGIGNKEDDTVE